MAMKAAAPPIAGRLSFPSLHPHFSSSQRFNSAFFGNVGSLKVDVNLRLANPSKLRCYYGHGGGGARMNLFDRVFRIIKSYVGPILSYFEDPEKIIEQSVVDMNEDLVEMNQATALVLASQKQLENKYNAAQQASEDWYKRAQLALTKGDEDLATEALKRRKSLADNAKALKLQLDQQKGSVDSLVSNTRILESKIQEARAKKDTLKARAQSAKTATKVSEMIGKVNTSGALSTFEKMEEKVMAMEFVAEALNQLTTDDLEKKFASLEDSSIDDDLATLKKEVFGSSKKLELPPGRSATVASASAPSFLFQDFENEKDLKVQSTGWVC